MIIASRTSLIALAVFALTGAAQAAEVPTLDVSRTCKPLASDVAIDTDRCYRAERAARDQLAKEWLEHPVADRSLCTATAKMGGMASYVTLITCLEMKRDVAKLPPDRGLTTRPSGMPIR